jgi:hypothetical protein
MRSLVTSLVLGLGVLGASVALPQQAKADGPWHGRYYRGYHGRYYAPGVFVAPTVVTPPLVAPAVVTAPTVVEPAIVAPAVVPYATFSYGWRGPAWRGYRSGYWYHR